MRSFILSGLFVLTSLSACDMSGTMRTTDDESAQPLVDPVGVIHAADGDTLDVIRDGEEFQVRFKGIDTPELWPKSDDDGSWQPEPFAEEAWTFVSSEVGALIGLEYDEACSPPALACKDPYDRVLAYVRLQDGRDLGEELLRAGLATVLIFDGEPFDRVTAYLAAQEDAQAAGVGLWAP